MQRINEPIGDVIDLADVFRALRNGWAAVATCVGAGLVGAIAILLFVPPSFSGKASLLLKTGGGGGAGSSLANAIGSLADAAGPAAAGGILQAPKTSVETEVEILQSRTLAYQVVDSLRLQAQITKPASVSAAAVFGRLVLPGSFRKRTYQFVTTGDSPVRYRFHSGNDTGFAIPGQAATAAVGNFVLSTDPLPKQFNVVFRDREDATTRLTEKLAFDKAKSDIAHFTYTGDDSLSAAAVPNLLIDFYLKRRKGVDRGLNQRTAEFLSAKVDSVGTALTHAERKLREEREANGAVEPLTIGETEFANENRIRQQLTDIQVQERTLQQLVGKIQDGTATPVQLAAYPPYLGSSPINTIINSLISVQTERQALLGTVTEQDERVKALDTRARELEARLLPLAQATLGTLSSQRTSLEQRVQGIQQSLVGLPRAAEAYTRLEREVVDLGKIYAGLQVKLVDARLNAITEGGDVRALDLAVPPKKPSFPKRSVTLAGGIGGGLFVGVILAVMLGLVGGRMHDAQDVERRLGLPAVRFEPAVPLLVGGNASRTVIVAPIDPRASVGPVAAQLVDTALARSITATLLDLTNAHESPASVLEPVAAGSPRLIATGKTHLGFDANAAIRRLEETHDLVVVQLPALTGREAAAVLDSTRPVLLVAPERRIERSRLQGAVDFLRRVGSPCAGVVLHGDDRRTLRA